MNNKSDDPITIKDKEKEDGVYVIQEIEVSDESEPEDIGDVESFDENFPEDNDIENLDKLMTATSKSDKKYNDFSHIYHKI